MEVFSWSFEHQIGRNRKWYVIATAISITSIIVSFLLGYYLFGVLIILFTGVYLLYEFNGHPLVPISITTEGISIQGDLFSYNKIESFAIIKITNVPPLLRIKTKNRTIGTFDIYIDPSLDIESLHLFLLDNLQEDTSAQLSVVDQILMRLKL